MERLVRENVGAIRADVGRISECFAGAIGALTRMAEPLLPFRLGVHRPGDQVANARIVGSASLNRLYSELCSIDNDSERTIVEGEKANSWANDEMPEVYLNLDRLDFNALAESLSYPSRQYPAEGGSRRDGRGARNPRCRVSTNMLLSSEILSRMKVRVGRGKWLIRQVLYRHVPAELVDRLRRGLRCSNQLLVCGLLKTWSREVAGETCKRNLVQRKTC